MGIQLNGNNDNISAVDGDLSITGIVTFSQLDVGNNIKLGNAGVITATSFVGSGADLTGLPAGGIASLVADTSPQLGGNLDVNTKNILFGDSASAGSDDTLIFGAGGDLQIFSDGTNGVLRNPNGRCYIQSDTGINLTKNGNTETLAIFNADGAAELYHNNEKKLFTKENGVQVEDTTATGAYLTMATSSGTAGKLYATGNNTLGFLDSQNHYMLKSTKDGAVDLYYDNSKKFETRGNGTQVTGTVLAGSSTPAAENSTYVFQAVGTSQAFISAYASNTGTNLNSHGMHFGQDTSRGYLTQRENKDIYFYTNNAHRLTLSNSGNLVPGSNNTYDLGSSSLRWNNIYTNDLNLSNKGSTNSVDNTWGDYTIQEGESDLFLINNRSGKKYKFNLTEVS